MTSIDNAMRAKLTNYNLVKGSLVQMQRKKTYEHFLFLSIPCINIPTLVGTYLCDRLQTSFPKRILYRTQNTSKRYLLQCQSLCTSVHASDDLGFTIFRNLVKDWHAKYERLANMVVPRSSKYSVSHLSMGAN